MTQVHPERFVIYKQGELDYFCGLYCLAMLKKNFIDVEAGEPYYPDRDFSSWVSHYPQSPTNGISTGKLLKFCGPRGALKDLGMELVDEKKNLTEYEYGIAMVATTFAWWEERYTHYVVFFDYEGQTFIADPHPLKSPKPTLLDDKFMQDWQIKKTDILLKGMERKYWPRPRWAIGKLKDT